MTSAQQHEKAQSVQAMFNRIARRYDIINRVISGGQDMRWRRELVARAALPPAGRLLDIATGTGDIAFTALEAAPGAQVVAADFAMQMMRVGQQRQPRGLRLSWTGADALRLPFADACFDAVVSGYLMRNVADIEKALAEQYRVLKPGGRIVILDTSPPPQNALQPLIHLHLRVGIPLIGRIIGGPEAASAYRYLPASTQAFKTPQALAQLTASAGFDDVGYKTLMFGALALHWGRKRLALPHGAENAPSQARTFSL